ncbi:hypothetical protein MKEN_00624100 [Mycena kentingensis (nom. inval.)]|nr:hypothetical protein MKEN_00624100 [Mycena kentingensis (nom. inval.)]
MSPPPSSRSAVSRLERQPVCVVQDRAQRRLQLARVQRRLCAAPAPGGARYARADGELDKPAGCVVLDVMARSTPQSDLRQLPRPALAPLARARAQDPPPRRVRRHRHPPRRRRVRQGARGDRQPQARVAPPEPRRRQDARRRPASHDSGAALAGGEGVWRGV